MGGVDAPGDRPGAGEEHLGIVNPLLQEVVGALELALKRLHLGLGLADGLGFQLHEGLLLGGRTFRPLEAVIFQPLGEGLQQTLLHDVVLGADVIAGAVRAHEHTAVGWIGAEDDAAAAFAADENPGQRIGDCVGGLNGRRAFLGNQLLGREENGLVHDGRVQAIDKDLLALRGGVVLDPDGAADNALFRLVDVPADFANVDGVFED